MPRQNPAKNELDELSEENALRLQMLMDRRQGAQQTVGNVLRRQAETAESASENSKD